MTAKAWRRLRQNSQRLAKREEEKKKLRNNREEKSVSKENEGKWLSNEKSENICCWSLKRKSYFWPHESTLWLMKAQSLCLSCGIYWLKRTLCGWRRETGSSFLHPLVATCCLLREIREEKRLSCFFSSHLFLKHVSFRKSTVAVYERKLSFSAEEEISRERKWLCNPLWSLCI